MNAHPEFQTVVHPHGPLELESFDAKISELMAEGWITSFQPFVYGGSLCQQMSRWPQAVPSKFSVDEKTATAAASAMDLLIPTVKGPSE
jgi:hypothetical protein